MTLDKLTQQFFKRGSDTVAKDLLGRSIVRRFPNDTLMTGIIYEVAAYEGKEKTSGQGMDYPAGVIGVSMKYGHHLIDISTNRTKASCITLIAAEFPLDFIHGPGKLAKYLRVDKTLDGTPIDHNELWIAGERTTFTIQTRQGKQVPDNCKGHYFFEQA